MPAFTKKLSAVFIVILPFLMAGCAHHPAMQDPAMDRAMEGGSCRMVDGWLLVESQPPAPRYKVLLLPGLLCTDLSYIDLLNDPMLSEAGVKVVAGNPPGFKGLPVKGGFDCSIEGYAREVEAISAHESYDLIVGHSFFANVLIEVAAAGRCQGTLMLLSPSLRRSSEAFDTRMLSHLIRVPGVGWFSVWTSYQVMGSFFRPCMNEENQGRVDALVAEGQKTPIPVAERLMAGFFDNIDTYGNLTGRLTSSKNRVWYVRGDKDRIILAEEDRAALGRSANVMVKDIPGGNHFIMIDRPSEVSALIIEALSGSVPAHPMTTGAASEAPAADN